MIEAKYSFSVDESLLIRYWLQLVIFVEMQPVTVIHFPGTILQLKIHQSRNKI